MNVQILATGACLALLTSSAFAQGVETRPPNAKGQAPAFAQQTRAPERKAGAAIEVVTVATGLEDPWGLAVLADGRVLVTEKPGRLRVVWTNGRLSPPVAGLPAVINNRQGGLLDVAADPAFARNGLIYWSYAEAAEGGANRTAVARGRLVDGAQPRLENVQVIYRQTPALNSPFHFGSRLVFARDGTLLITQGERGLPAGRVQSQDLGSLLGKVVRINADGTIPKNNPFVGKAGVRPEIWSYGHRNIQGAAIHPRTGELWEVEHGDRGGDELNIARKGKNYGWPVVAYGITYAGGAIGEGVAKPGMEPPVYYWDPVIAPGGLAFYDHRAIPAWRGSLFVAGLASKHLSRLTLDGDKVVGEERLLGGLGERVRDVKAGADGAVYVAIAPCGNDFPCALKPPAGTPDTRGRIMKLVAKQR